MIRYLVPLSKIISLRSLVAASGLPCFFPFYHTVGYGNKLPHINKLYNVITPEKFEKHIDFLLKYFNPISVEQLINGNYSSPAMLLSFDDGFRGVKDYAHDILQKKGVEYVLFVNPDFINNRKLMYRCKQSLLINYLVDHGEHELLINSPQIRLDDYSKDETAISELAERVGFSFEDYLEKEKPYLTTQDLVELHKAGVAIGGHSMDHPLYELISLKEQKEQTRESAEWVRSEVGETNSLFSFPFTDNGVSKEFMKWLSTSDNIRLSFGSAKLKLNSYPNHHQRLCMEDCRIDIGNYMKSEFLAFIIKRISTKARVQYS